MRLIEIIHSCFSLTFKLVVYSHGYYECRMYRVNTPSNSCPYPVSSPPNRPPMLFSLSIQRYVVHVLSKHSSPLPHIIIFPLFYTMIECYIYCWTMYFTDLSISVHFIDLSLSVYKELPCSFMVTAYIFIWMSHLYLSRSLVLDSWVVFIFFLFHTMLLWMYLSNVF